MKTLGERIDPDTFQFKSAISMPGGGACFKYRAQNGFGAMGLGEAVVTPEGKIYYSDRDKNQFVSVFNKICTKDGGEDILYIVTK